MDAFCILQELIQTHLLSELREELPPLFLQAGKRVAFSVLSSNPRLSNLIRMSMLNVSQAISSLRAGTMFIPLCVLYVCCLCLVID